ncbi:uncharacterized protein LOC116022262 [Ipomoea triloba]|uniref:uncharacterized protein LOC116022262 n=1 Tax=Ipomoea triloba TaxID=35885 RepID=UPI00125E8DED|nr:uncharacterized protein LOC116022262 [Ipomoea triloba]
MRNLARIKELLIDKCGGLMNCIQTLSKCKGPSGFSTSKVYEIIRPRAQKSFAFKFIWRGFVPPKYAFTTWLCLKGRLPTKDRLRFLAVDEKCSFCGKETENINHLFFTCDFSRQVWEEVRNGLGISRKTGSIKGAIKWAYRDARGSRLHSKIGPLAILCSVYHIWRTRNALIFEGTQAVASKTRTIIIYQVLRILYKIAPGGLRASVS